MKILFPLLAALALVGCTEEYVCTDPEAEKCLTFNMGISFPPVTNAEQRNFAAPLLKELNVNKVRFAENWQFREPEEGVYKWSGLDDRIDWTNENNLDLLLTIQSNGPDWACRTPKNNNSCVYKDNTKFKSYVEQLLQRYPNQIAKIQFGNEWQTDFWYIGNGQEFVEASNIVYDAIQQYSPDTTFVLGGFTSVSLAFLAGCDGLIDEFYGDSSVKYNRQTLDEECKTPRIQNAMDKIDYVLKNAHYDEIDVHLYDDPENWAIYYDNFITMIDKPIIVTEFGGPNVSREPTTESYQAQQLQKYIEAIDKLDISEAYYFKLVEGTDNPAHVESGLIDYPSLAKKQSYYTFQDLNNR